MSNDTIYLSANSRFSQLKLDEAMLSLILGVKKIYSDICVICIGTDRATGDCYGPIIGHMLSKLSLIEIKLYGTLQNPVHALSLETLMQSIDTKQSLIIAIDAGVGDASLVGSIGLSYKPVMPGSGLGKKLPPVGDISVTGIVAMGGLAPFMMLQNAPLGMVYDMSEKTFFALQYALRKVQKSKISYQALLQSQSSLPQ